MPSSKFQPALYGGILLGVLSALPIVSLGNVCCCLWILIGGATAAYLLQANQASPVSLGDGASVGLLAGVVGSVVQLVLSVPISMMMGPLQGRMLERLLSNAGDMPENVRPMLEAMKQGGVSVVGAIFSFFAFLFIAGLFSTLGGLIGAAMFRRKAPAVPPALPPAGYEGPIA